MATFHLRPVNADRSTSPSTSTSTTSDRSSPHILKPAPIALPRSSSRASPSTLRRPFSPPSLRDVNLPSSPADSDLAPRKYPAPPTGHELMALFPPAPPAINMPPGPTSGYFEREERAFFAQAGKEIVRVRIEFDLPDADHKPAPRPWLAPSASQSPPPPPSQPVPVPFPHTAGRGVRPSAAPVSPHAGPPYPAAPKPHPHAHAHAHAHQHPHPHPQPQPQHAPHAHAEAPPPHPAAYGAHAEEAFRDDPDEAWRRPMPHNERRRAGKHTKRVIVK